MTLEKATRVFSHGFAFTRSFTHPYVVAREHGLTVMKDAPRTSGDRRNSEYVVQGLPPSKGVAALKKAAFAKGGVAVVCDPGEDLDEVRDVYKEAGLRLVRREPFFAADPTKAPRYKSPVPIVRVRTEEQADQVKRAMRTRQILPEHLDREDTIRLYAAINGRSVVGIVKSIPVEDCAWVSNLFVDKSMRGKGIGRALMSTMLQDDAKHGIEHSVLLASTAGSRLYPHVGYERIGTLVLFVPTPRWRA
jgi:GNAT superfamily N-acetyltransferase